MSRLIVLILFAFALSCPALAQLRGHDGPVRAVATSADGALALSAGFDGAAIVWGLKSGQALELVRPHDAPATAAAISRDIAFATGDQNGRVALWRLGGAPKVIEAHVAPVVAIAPTGDGRAFLSAGLDGSIVRIDSDTGDASAFARRAAPLAGICAEGDTAIVAQRDGALRWISRDGHEQRSVALGETALTLACDHGLVFVGLADGRVMRVAAESRPAEIMTLNGPVTALTAHDGHVAAAAATGEIAALDHGRRRDFAAKRGAAVWGLGVAGHDLLAAGADGFVRRYDFFSGQERAPADFATVEDLPPPLRDHPGARVFEACRVCHSLKPGEHRAGPSLAGVIGRKIGAAEGYLFSDALKRMDIVWSRESIARLFEIGPQAMTPGTKMPEQKVVAEADRAALAEFIEVAGSLPPR